MPTTRSYTIIGLLLVFVSPLLIQLIRINAGGIPDTPHVLLSEACYWASLLLLLLIIKYGEKTSFEFLGLRARFLPTAGTAALILVGILAAVLIFGGVTLFVFKQKPPAEPLAQQLKSLPVWVKVLLAIRAGVLEEIFFRGYAINRLKQLTNNNLLAVILPLCIFALLHAFYGTVFHVVAAFIIGSVLTVFYLRTNNLTANIISHSVWDLIGFLIK